MGEEVGVWGGTYAVTKGFYDKYGPDRIKDTPFPGIPPGIDITNTANIEVIADRAVIFGKCKNCSHRILNVAEDS